MEREMKIVNLKKFMGLPEGTVFSKYTPVVFESLSVKQETIHETSDFCYEEIDLSAIDNESSDDFADKLFDSEKNGTSLKMDFDFTGRDGCFKSDQLFAVMEKEDVVMLIDKLKRCLDTGYDDNNRRK